MRMRSFRESTTNINASQHSCFYACDRETYECVGLTRSKCWRNRKGKFCHHGFRIKQLLDTCDTSDTAMQHNGNEQLRTTSSSICRYLLPQCYYVQSEPRSINFQSRHVPSPIAHIIHSSILLHQNIF
jgi:hypothetical protein